jgi:hypothetical protein
LDLIRAQKLELRSSREHYPSRMKRWVDRGTIRNLGLVIPPALSRGRSAISHSVPQRSSPPLVGSPVLA